jgi:putative ABC transport system substrate-binding protein
MMKRRAFITLLGGAAVAWARPAFTQDSHKRPLVAWLGATTAKVSLANADFFLQGMRELGYVEGRDFDMVYRFSDDYQDRLPALAEELVRLKPDVIIAAAVVAAVAARKVTSTIPIVSPALADAVHLGLVSSEARPGGNVTGIEPYVAGLPAKQMELAREIVARASTVGLLANVNDPKAAPQVQEMEDAARMLQVKIVVADASRPEDLDGALQTLASERVDVVIVLQSSMLFGNSRKIAASALTKRLPTVYGYREHVLAGGLVSYGVDLPWCYRRGAFFVDKILHGTRPGDLPVEFPTKMVLSVNLKTANVLGVTVPPSLLARADEVIE